MRADVNVFDLERVGERQPEIVHDFPGGAPGRSTVGSSRWSETVTLNWRCLWRSEKDL